MERLTIGLLIDWLDSDYAGSLTFAFLDEVASRGMRFLCFVGHGISPEGQEGSAIAYRLASAAAIDGLVIASLGRQATSRDYASFLARFGALPVCTLMTSVPGIPHISIDDASGMRDAVQHLIDVHGRRRIAFIRGPETASDANERYRGYVEALEARGLPLDPALVAPGNFSPGSGREAVRVLGRGGAPPCDAIACANDSMAREVLEELAALGVAVPDTVAITGFDDVEDSRFASPPISSVRQPWRLRARLAVDALLATRAGQQSPDQRVPTEFVPRASCGCSVGFDGLEARPARQLALRVTNWDWQKAIASAFARDVSSRGIPLGEEPARALVECYWQEVQGQREGGFILLFEQALSDQLGHRSSLSAWYHCLARLRQAALERLQGKPEARARAETLMHAALQRVSHARERQQALRRLEYERQGRLLALAGQAMRTAFDVRGISSSLRQQLPQLGIPRFFVAQYSRESGGDLEPPRRSRLVVSHEGATTTPPETLEFDTERLVPPGLWPDEALGFVVEALYSQGDPLGFALFQIGPRQGSIYAALREQLSAALKGAALVVQVAERALQREQAERARMQEELRIARRVQASILPARWEVPGLDLAASLLPGQLPGADYFDIRPDPGGAWLAVGSVRGGDLRPGLIIPMLQTIVASLCQRPDAIAPSELLRTALLVLRENLEVRMQERQYINLLVARYSTSGRVQLAADYPGITVCPWHGSPFRPELTLIGTSPQGEPLLGGELELYPHDLLLLYTQGLTRSSDFEDVPIGDERIARELELGRASPVEKIRDDMLSLVQRWSGKRADLSVIVGRQVGVT